MATLFISDLHLHADRPAGVAALLALLETAAARGDALFILGDLFEYWLGDDDDAPPHDEVTAALARYVAQGGQAALLHGNRDFLIAGDFCARTGCRLLEDPHCIELAGRRALLMHGDLLCTRDHDYQRLRQVVRNPAWQANMLARPLAERRALALQLRDTSRAETGGKAAGIMDVEQATVEDYLRRHDCRLLIHGHTHRPGEHLFSLDGASALRLVLADWYEGDSVLCWQGTSYRRMSVGDYCARG